MKDNFGRNIDYLRISLTDRCNLRCVYCMPECGVDSIPHNEILRLEEIEHVVKIASELGIKHIRLTGGEPLVRRGIERLIYNLKSIDKIESVALTTNATLLAPLAKNLKSAGLDRVNVSIDSLNPDQYAKITRRGNLNDALDGIYAALQCGLSPVKINCVVVKSLNQDLLEFAKLTIQNNLHVRFIEYMPVGDTLNLTGCNWGADEVISAEKIIDDLKKQCEISGLGEITDLNDDSVIGWGPAKYYKIKGAKGTIGTISAISNHFCNSCNRLRLTSDGKIKPCLFSDVEYDIKTPLRSGNFDDVYKILEEALKNKPHGHEMKKGTSRKMSQIGG